MLSLSESVYAHHNVVAVCSRGHVAGVVDERYLVLRLGLGLVLGLVLKTPSTVSRPHLREVTRTDFRALGSA